MKAKIARPHCEQNKRQATHTHTHKSKEEEEEKRGNNKWWYAERTARRAGEWLMIEMEQVSWCAHRIVDDSGGRIKAKKKKKKKNK